MVLLGKKVIVMNIDWTVVLVALLGSNLIVEIWKTIRDSIQKKKKINVEAEFTRLNETVSMIREDMNGKFTNDMKRLNDIEHTLKTLTELMSRTSKGTILSLENDTIVFNAFRNNHINGESEEQEKKLKAYYKECAEFNLQMH